MKKFIYIVAILFIISFNNHAQWFYQGSGINTNLYSIFSIDGETTWLTGADGVIIKTTNNGATWIQKPSGTNVALSFVHFFNMDEGIVAGSNGTVLKSSDGGNSWYSVSSGTFLRLQEGTFVNDSVGYLIGDSGILLKTTDRGNTWSNSVIAPEDFSYIYFTNEETGFATTEWSGQIWKTTDAGNSWQLKHTAGSIHLWQIHFADELNGWVVGQFGTILNTSNGGESWNLQNSGSNENLRSVYFHNANEGWVVGKDENRLITTDGGNNWIFEHFGFSYEYLHIYFYNDLIGWICGTSGSILYTDNNAVPIELNSYTAEVVDNEVQVEWVTATELNNSGFEIERKFQNDNWEKISFVPGYGTTTEQHTYNYVDKPEISGKIYYRLKQIDYDGSFTYSDEIEVVLNPVEFNLAQNYPNPFNPSTIINFQIAEETDVTLKIFDALGNEVAVLVNEVKPAGSYQYNFNAEGLTSGIYFYKIETENFSATKKMLLLK